MNYKIQISQNKAVANLRAANPIGQILVQGHVRLFAYGEQIKSQVYDSLTPKVSGILVNFFNLAL